VKKKKEPKAPVPIPSDLEEFQSQYGNEWLQITRHPAFIAGTQLLNIRKLKEITTLSDDQIERNGREILASLRGHLQHEDDLFTLHSKSEFKLPTDDQEEYLSPEEAAEHEALIERFREKRKRDHYGTG
jgi:hypothetical protein